MTAMEIDRVSIYSIALISTSECLALTTWTLTQTVSTTGMTWRRMILMNPLTVTATVLVTRGIYIRTTLSRPSIQMAMALETMLTMTMMAMVS